MDLFQGENDRIRDCVAAAVVEERIKSKNPHLTFREFIIIVKGRASTVAQQTPGLEGYIGHGKKISNALGSFRNKHKYSHLMTPPGSPNSRDDASTQLAVAHADPRQAMSPMDMELASFCANLVKGCAIGGGNTIYLPGAGNTTTTIARQTVGQNDGFADEVANKVKKAVMPEITTQIQSSSRTLARTIFQNTPTSDRYGPSRGTMDSNNLQAPVLDFGADSPQAAPLNDRRKSTDSDSSIESVTVKVDNDCANLKSPPELLNSKVKTTTTSDVRNTGTAFVGFGANFMSNDPRSPDQEPAYSKSALDELTKATSAKGYTITRGNDCTPLLAEGVTMNSLAQVEHLYLTFGDTGTIRFLHAVNLSGIGVHKLVELLNPNRGEFPKLTVAEASQEIIQAGLNSPVEVTLLGVETWMENQPQEKFVVFVWNHFSRQGLNITGEIVCDRNNGGKVTFSLPSLFPAPAPLAFGQSVPSHASMPNTPVRHTDDKANAKKLSSGFQLMKGHTDDEDDDVSSGDGSKQPQDFQRAPEAVLSKRKIAKGRIRQSRSGPTIAKDSTYVSVDPAAAAAAAGGGIFASVVDETAADEEEVFDCVAKYQTAVDGKWKPGLKGTLRIYRHVQLAKSRVVIRDMSGRARFNVGIAKGMSFEKHVYEAKSRMRGYVTFQAVQDKEKGVETFMLQANFDDVNRLHQILTQMADLSSDI